MGLGGFGSVDIAGLGCINFDGFCMFVFLHLLYRSRFICFCCGWVNFGFFGVGFRFFFSVWEKVGLVVLVYWVL